jgi:hypothetical protein
LQQAGCVVELKHTTTVPGVEMTSGPCQGPTRSDTFSCFVLTSFGLPACLLACCDLLSCRLIELLPDDPSGYSNRSYAFRKLGDYEAAVEDYTTALALTGTGSTRLHNNRCELCTKCSGWLGSSVGSVPCYPVLDSPATLRQHSHLHAGVLHVVFSMLAADCYVTVSPCAAPAAAAAAAPPLSPSSGPTAWPSWVVTRRPSQTMMLS